MRASLRAPLIKRDTFFADLINLMFLRQLWREGQFK